MSYTSNGKIPEKYMLKEMGNISSNQQTYFKGSELENKDFEHLNEVIKDKKMYEILSYKKDEKGSNTIVMDNEPVKLKLVYATNQSYSRYGSNYPFRVMLPNGLITVIGTDIVLESLYNFGCDKEGNLHGEYIIASNGNYLSFIRHGSNAHKACLEHMKEVEKPIMNTKDYSFEFGRIYKRANNKMGVFLGYVDTIHMTTTTNTDQSNKITKINVKQKNIKMASLWYMLEAYQTNKDVAAIKEHIMQKISNDYYYFSLYDNNNHKFVSTDDRKINFDSPKEIIYSISNLFRQKALNDFEHIKKSNIPYKSTISYYNQRSGISSYAINHMYSHSKFVNMDLFGVTPKVNSIYTDIDKYVMSLVGQQVY